MRTQQPAVTIRTVVVFRALGIAALICVSGAVPHAHADLLQLVGEYAGQVNGLPVVGSATGQLDTTGNTLNHFEAVFDSIPFNPLSLSNSWNSSRTNCALLASGGALNIFDLSGGNFHASRSVSWPSLPGDSITVSGPVSVANGIMTFSDIVEGTYSGPTDLLGVIDYDMLWTQLDPTSVEVAGTATIDRANGEHLVADISVLYTGLSLQMPMSQTSTVAFSNEQFDGTVLSFDWQGTVVPEPGGGLLVAVGLLTICALRGRYQAH